MITIFITKNVSETHNLNNPHEKTASGCFDSEAENTRTQCEDSDNLLKISVSERRALYLINSNQKNFIPAVVFCTVSGIII